MMRSMIWWSQCIASRAQAQLHSLPTPSHTITYPLDVIRVRLTLADKKVSVKYILSMMMWWLSQPCLVRRLLLWRPQELFMPSVASVAFTADWSLCSMQLCLSSLCRTLRSMYFVTMPFMKAGMWIHWCWELWGRALELWLKRRCSPWKSCVVGSKWNVTRWPTRTKSCHPESKLLSHCFYPPFTTSNLFILFLLSMWASARQLVKNNGVKSLFAGLVPTYLKIIPTVAVFACVSQSLNAYFKKKKCSAKLNWVCGMKACSSVLLARSKWRRIIWNHTSRSPPLPRVCTLSPFLRI